MEGTRASRTREAILDATDRLLAREGFRKVTIEDIAREAGCSRRAIYSHFATKAEVGLSSIDRVIEQAHARLLSISAEGGSPAARLGRMLIERVLHRIDTVHAYRQSLDELFEAVRPAYMERRRRHFVREAEIVATVLEEGRAQGDFVYDDTMATALTLVRATNAFLPYSLSAEELGQRAELVEGITKMTDLLLRGLSPARAAAV
jgi:AcrR family transcriptional regulator